MRILFDLQEYLIEKPLGELVDNDLLRPYGESHPSLFVEMVEDTKVIRVFNRTSLDAGVEILLCSISNIDIAKRIIVVGRLGYAATVQLIKITLSTKDDEHVELSYFEPYNNLYAISCLAKDVARDRLYLSLTKSGDSSLGFDFFIDGILVVH